MIVPADSGDLRAELSAMILELQTNRGILSGLSKYYGKFRFTGGNVTAERWGLAAITLYGNRPFAADRIVTAETERYRQLAEAIMELGQSVARSGPKTLRRRFDIADAFGRASTEIQALGSTLEVAIAKLLEESEPSSSSLSKKGFAVESVEFAVSPMVGVERT